MPTLHNDVAHTVFSDFWSEMSYNAYSRFASATIQSLNTLISGRASAPYG
jgi:hypothetical protein